MNLRRQAGLVLLAPVLLGQALTVRARALRLPEAAGPRAGETGQGAPLRVLFLGDSSAAGVGVQHQSEGLAGQVVAALSSRFSVHWQLLARTGDTTRQATEHLGTLHGTAFDAAVIALGVNDATRMIPAQRWVAQGQALRAQLRDRFGVRRIYVSDMPPLGDFPLLPQPLARVIGAHATALQSAQIAALAQEPDCRLVRPRLDLTPDLMAPDGFHPGRLAYAAWGQAVARHIARDFAA